MQQKYSCLLCLLLLLLFAGSCHMQTQQMDYWLAFPTVFTPNADGINDTFKAYGNGIAEFRLSIYSRQGVLCYQTNSWSEASQQGWDGKKDQQTLPAGMYVWVVEGRFSDGSALQDLNGKTTGTVYMQP